MDANKLQRLCDESEIREVITRYCRAADRCDIELAKSAYWPDATDDHISFSGNAMDFVDYAMPLLKDRLECTVHMIGNIWMQIEENMACSETYVNAYHRFKSIDTKIEVVVGARYLDRFERRAGEWRIAERTLVIDWEKNGAIIYDDETLKNIFMVDKPRYDDDSYCLFRNKTLR